TKEKFLITLTSVNGEKIDSKQAGFFIKTKLQADQIVGNLESASYQVSKVLQKEVRKYPGAPFTTSTLQQAAGNKLGFTAKRTMMIAQNLYEQGFITYMRTDSVNLSSQALTQAR